jgi:DNA ligase-1
VSCKYQEHLGVEKAGEMQEWSLKSPILQVSGLARTIVSEPRNWKPVRYIIFDAPQVKGGLMARLEGAKKKVAGCKYARVLEHEVCKGYDHVVEELKRVEDLGGEGLMLRNATAAHRAGRTPDLLKVKTQHDDEAVVEGHEPGNGKHAGVVGALLCKTREGKQFKVGTGLTDADRSNPPAVGSVITYGFHEKSKDGIPRFPAFKRLRAEVDPW